MWRYWGYFIHNEAYEPVVNQLFSIRHDNSLGAVIEDDDYNMDAIWVRKDVPDTLKFCIDIFSELWDIIKADTSQGWSEEAGFRKDLVDSIKFIVFSHYSDYEAH